MNEKEFVIDDDVLVSYVGEDKHAVIPDGVKIIGNKSFCECNKLESVAVPDSVKYICRDAFYKCPSLKNVDMPDSVMSVG